MKRGASVKSTSADTLACRGVDPARTVARLTEVGASAGITRLADVTMLDIVGLPVWQAIRPLSKNLTVSQGKGLTADQAKAGALMEAIEMFFAESPPLDEVAPLDNMVSGLGYEVFALPSRQAAGPPAREAIEWSKGWFLADNRPTFVPRDLLNLDFTRSNLCRPWLLPTSNGLAGGNCREEAIVHGLYEVIERHSLRVGADRPDPDCIVDTGSFSSESMRSVLDACRRASLAVEFQDRTCELQVPCFQARLLTAGWATEMFGSGAHWSAETAALKALLEALQSRLTAITGSRDDIDELDFYPHAGRPLSRPPRARRPLRHSVGGAHVNEGVQGELAYLLRVLARFGYSPIIVTLAQEEGSFYVCFTVVPGLRL